jgi:hypothetical protein
LCSDYPETRRCPNCSIARARAEIPPRKCANRRGIDDESQLSGMQTLDLGDRRLDVAQHVGRKTTTRSDRRRWHNFVAIDAT